MRKDKQEGKLHEVSQEDEVGLVDPKQRVTNHCVSDNSIECSNC